MAGSRRLEGASALRAIPLRQALVHPVDLPRTAVQDPPTSSALFRQGRVTGGAAGVDLSCDVHDPLGLLGFKGLAPVPSCNLRPDLSAARQG